MWPPPCRRLRGAVKAQAGSLRAGKGQETRPLPGANITGTVTGAGAQRAPAGCR